MTNRPPVSDPRARVELRELIALMATEMNKTVLISSHILTELGEICDSAAIIEAGEILASGTIEEIQNSRKRQRENDEHVDEPEETILAARVMNDVERLERWLLEQPFVSAVNSGPQQVSFSFIGDQAAQRDLLKRIIDNDFSLLEFTGKTQSLEDAFMAITKGITQ